jgi:murein DD-endopeptidase MepM/ murein hydrolase activator NlpD
MGRDVYRAVRLFLAAVLVLGSFLVPLGGPKEARAQLPPIPIPDLPELPDLPIPLPDPQPEPEESPSPTPTPEEDGAPDDDGGSPGGPAGSPSDDQGSNPHGGSSRKGRGPGRPSPGIEFEPEIPNFDYARIPGSYSTDGLVMAATRLRSLGWSRSDVVSEVFRPFIVGGEANWVDSWGALRSGPGSILRTHEGQDVFCRYGAPVLAAESGVVAYGTGGLGGIVARLYRPGGGYWYYAHLSRTNNEDFPAGSKVEPGDVIGYCGNSGNAITTPPHVHFGRYETSGRARNPMRMLVSWLERAERRAGLTVARAEGEQIIVASSLIAARRFGDGLIPGSELAATGAPRREEPAAGAFSP